MAKKKRPEEEILAEVEKARDFLASTIAGFFFQPTKPVSEMSPNYVLRLAKSARRQLAAGQEPSRQAARGHKTAPEHPGRKPRVAQPARATPIPQPQAETKRATPAERYRQAVNVRLTTRQRLEAIPTLVRPIGQQSFLVESSVDTRTVEAIEILGKELPDHVISIGWQDRDGKYHTFYERGILAKSLLRDLRKKRGNPSERWVALMTEIYEAAYNLEEPEADDFQNVSITVATGYAKRS